MGCGKTREGNRFDQIRQTLQSSEEIFAEEKEEKVAEETEYSLAEDPFAESNRFGEEIDALYEEFLEAKANRDDEAMVEIEEKIADLKARMQAALDRRQLDK